jgi:nitronate monooxygenase
MEKGGDMIAAEAGSELARPGTRCSATVEANADTAYKKALTEYSVHDTVHTHLFTGISRMRRLSQLMPAAIS